MEVKVFPGEGICYWCGKTFKRIGVGCKASGWREHVNIAQETPIKIFCSEICKRIWIDHKQTFGELMP